MMEFPDSSTTAAVTKQRVAIIAENLEFVLAGPVLPPSKTRLALGAGHFFQGLIAERGSKS
jgi:hypothetical protein